MCVVPNGEIIILKRHPVQEELHGNGNGLLVVSKSADYLHGSLKGRQEHLWLCLALHSYIMQIKPYLGNIFLATKRISVPDLWTNVI